MGLQVMVSNYPILTDIFKGFYYYNKIIFLSFFFLSLVLSEFQTEPNTIISSDFFYCLLQ